MTNLVKDVNVEQILDKVVKLQKFELMPLTRPQPLSPFPLFNRSRC